MPCNINNNLPTESAFWNGPSDTTRSETTSAVQRGNVGLPNVLVSNSGRGNGTGRVGSLEGVLVAGIVVSVAVGGLSAWL